MDNTNVTFIENIVKKIKNCDVKLVKLDLENDMDIITNSGLVVQIMTTGITKLTITYFDKELLNA